MKELFVIYCEKTYLGVNMRWLKYTIHTTTEATDIIAGLLTDNGIDGVEIDDNVQLTEEEQNEAITVVLPDLPADNGEAYVSFYLDASLSDGEITGKLALVKDTLASVSEYTNIGAGTITHTEINDDEFKDNWKEFFHAFRVDKDIVVKPLWEDLPDDLTGSKVTLILDPGMAFGTGRHETTQLSMLNLKKYMKGGNSVLDIGTGSGILAILAKKLGASFVLGTDIDEPAVDIAVENTAVNSVNALRKDVVLTPDDMNPNKIIYSFANVFDTEVRKNLRNAFKGGADLVVANILADVIVPICGFVKELAKPGSYFITSGIFYDKVDAVKCAAASAGLEFIETLPMNDWNSIVFRIPM